MTTAIVFDVVGQRLSRGDFIVYASGNDLKIARVYSVRCENNNVTITAKALSNRNVSTITNKKVLKLQTKNILPFASWDAEILNFINYKREDVQHNVQQ